MNTLDLRQERLRNELKRFTRAFISAKRRKKTTMSLTDIDNLIREQIFQSALEITGSKIKSAELLEIHRNLFYTARAK